MKEGDSVTVRNLDDEQADGTIQTIHDETVDEVTAEWWGDGERSLYEYWRGTEVSPSDPVVTVQLGDREYDYPASRVEVLDG